MVHICVFQQRGSRLGSGAAQTATGVLGGAGPARGGLRLLPVQPLSFAQARGASRMGEESLRGGGDRNQQPGFRGQRAVGRGEESGGGRRGRPGEPPRPPPHGPRPKGPRAAQAAAPAAGGELGGRRCCGAGARGLGPLGGCTQGSAGAHLSVGSREADVLDPVPRCEAGAYRLGAAEAGLSGAK